MLTLNNIVASALLVSSAWRDNEFDYVIVGAGTAGNVMANRLSEDPNIQVALIEAGTTYDITNPVLGATPAGDVLFCGASPLSTNPGVDWNFITEPQTGAGNRRIHYARGKCLGGTSARNFMIYQRGTRQSYQKWADEVGDASYTFDNFLPYFKKGMQFTPPSSKRAQNASAEYVASAFTPGEGPHQVSYANYAQTWSSYMEGGFQEVGMPIAQDFNSGTLRGGQYCSSTIIPTDQHRGSSDKTYLAAASARPNLKVFQLTMAKQITFNGNKKATGVLVEAAGLLPFVISARKEVILSAGAFHSPQLLMVSGIGPAATLKEFNIPVLVNNPNVGQNMWDHVFAGPSYRVALETFTRLANDLVYVGEQFIANYTLAQEGPLTNPVSDWLAWERVPARFKNKFSLEAKAQLAYFPEDWPEIEYISGAGYVGDFADLFTSQPKDGYMYATILSTIVAPVSRGTVTIASADTNVLPVINPNWLVAKADQEVAVAAYKRAREVFNSKFVGQVRIGDEYFPGNSVQTDEQILKVYQDTLLTVWHAACTCKMGRVGDPKAVVDTKARVFGVQGLRVVDASAFAVLPPGHPQSTIYALAEKIAAGIKTGN
ncbi:alcohol oxidase [Pseudovirgaria hyperparasitica]|uniref:Alcohol oxidase n=1 Tax=Pseudovirgaria hyperparasitica TaxID=470096 RepID=A0A6A6W7Q4_9PEZI|nr:alcohol oxidase [Pseudovirgaria hyperparasitica]KAF2758892.1 alcohol oxidase [Pseudovirgaria hyperparasitica]